MLGELITGTLCIVIRHQQFVLLVSSFMVAHVAVAHSIGSTVLHEMAVCCRYVVGM